MIITLHKPGRSFKGVCRYLMHDAKAETTERVAWTHTLNLASDHNDVNSAVNEMLWTYRAADALKRDAGISTGGSRLEKPVKHFSLSWPHGVTPSKAHMIETVRAYMEHMGWADRQAVLVAHDDKRHAHAHVVMNSVSPEDGRAVRSSHDWRRTEAFALQYEREHGQIHCEQRLKPKDEREATPTREAWQKLKPSEIAFDRAEVERMTKASRHPVEALDYFGRNDDTSMNSREWEALKAYQKHERERHFMGGKQAFRNVRNDVFKAVREEFRGQWNAYYTAARGGHGKTALAETKIALTAAQNRALDARRQTAFDQLKETREEAYQKILAQQRFDRAELGKRQKLGLRTYQLMDVIYRADGPAPALAPAPVALTHEKQPNQGEKTPPTIREGGWALPSMTSSFFSQTAKGAVEPDQRVERPDGWPGLRTRAETWKPVHTVDGFGRSLKEFVQAQGPKRQEAKQQDPVKPVEAPRAPAPVMTDTAVDAQRVHKARETDKAAVKEKVGEVVAMRASWNRHRRSRGGRD